MSSLIDPTKPATGAATTASVRDNFARAASEISALQTDIASLESAPPAHAASHQSGGTDPIGTVTPGPGAIPMADALGKLDGWISAGAGAPSSQLWLPLGKYSLAQGSTSYAGRIRVTSAFLPCSMQVTHIRHRWYSRVDASDVYSLGVYDTAGNLVLTTGAIDPTGFVGDSLIEQAVVGGPVSLPPGTYLLAWTSMTGNCTVWLCHSEFLPGFIGADPYHGYPAESSTGGVLPSSISLPLSTMDAYRGNTAWMALIGS